MKRLLTSRSHSDAAYSGFLLAEHLQRPFGCLRRYQKHRRLRERCKIPESRRGSAVLVMQIGRTIFVERYANDGSATDDGRSLAGQKVFWGIAALVGCARGALFRLDDPAVRTRSTDVEKWIRGNQRITIRQLLSQTDGIEGASRLQRPSIRDRNAMAIGLPSVAEPGSAFIYGPSHLQIFSELLRRN
jgi:CubicO group peptidase (beta-lactamase class C family)